MILAEPVILCKYPIEADWNEANEAVMLFATKLGTTTSSALVVDKPAPPITTLLACDAVLPLPPTIALYSSLLIVLFIPE